MYLKTQLASGEMILVGSTVLTKDQYTRWKQASEEAENFDLLQGVRKVLLS